MSSEGPIRRYCQGESIVFDVPAALTDGVPAERGNCTASFVLADSKFSTGRIWEADLYDGLTVVAPGVFRVVVPQRVADTLRRGSFLYSLTVTDKRSKLRRVCEEGTLLIEYTATSPSPDLGYKASDGDQTSA